MNIDKYKNMMFLDADTGGGDGGADDANIAAGGGEAEVSRGEAAFEPTPKITTGDRPLPQKKTEATPAGSGPSGAETDEDKGAPPTGGFDAAKFAKEFGASLSESLKPVLERAQPEEPLTPEKACELLNVWEPDENWYKSYDNLETRAEAIGQMRDGLINQGDTLTQYRIREAIDTLHEEIMPSLRTVSETANLQREQRFGTQFPQLAKPEMQPLIKAIAQDLVDQKKTFKTEGELFKALANGVEAVIKVNNPDFKLETVSSSGGNHQTEDRGGRNLPVTTPGGGGGTGRREGGNKPEPKRGLAIFGK